MAIRLAETGPVAGMRADSEHTGREQRLQRSMDAKTNLKAKLPSRHVTEGPARAPHRSYYYAMGLTTEQIHQPFVGVASCWN